VITIKDIARELGYSISTVSRALQNHPDISEETKRVVVAYARDHHYRPNQLASSLRTQKNTTIGVLLPDITRYFFSTILAGVEKAANEAGYNVLIARTKEEPERERQCVQMLLNSRVAGIIACPTKRTTDFSPYQDIIRSGTPLVLVDRLSPISCDQIISDDYMGAFQAVEYLIQTGCKRIDMLSTPYVTHVVSERQRGYRDALQHYNIPFFEDHIHLCDDRESAVVVGVNLFSSDDHPDGFFCVNDAMADGLVYVAKMRGIAIPDQLSICGFSDDIITGHTDPMQTTVHQYGHRMGRLAMTRLIARIDANEDLAPETTVLPVSFIVRETTH